MFSIRIWQKKSSEKLSLEQYSIITSFVSYENTALVQRNSFYLLANVALLVAALGPTQKLLTCIYSLSLSDRLVCASEQSTVSVIAFGLSVTGLILSVLWLLSFQASKFWLHHWYENLKELESGAFGNCHLLRNFDPNNKYPCKPVSATGVLLWTIYLILIVWSLVTFFILYVWSNYSLPHFMCVVASVVLSILFFHEIYWRYKQEFKMEELLRRQRQS